MNKILAAILLGSAFLSAPALAEPYIGAGIGMANTDGQHFSYKLFTGYQIIQNVGVELAYTDLGSYRSAAAKAISFAVVGTLPLNAEWNLTGKIGNTANNTKFSGDATHSTMMTAVGASWNYEKKMVVSLEYEDYGKLHSIASVPSTSATNLTLNGKYSF